jgi:hypothetical protein
VYYADTGYIPLLLFHHLASDHLFLKLPPSLTGGMITVFHVSGQAVLRDDRGKRVATRFSGSALVSGIFPQPPFAILD